MGPKLDEKSTVSFSVPISMNRSRSVASPIACVAAGNLLANVTVGTELSRLQDHPLVQLDCRYSWTVGQGPGWFPGTRIVPRNSREARNG